MITRAHDEELDNKQQASLKGKKLGLYIATVTSLKKYIKFINNFRFTESHFSF